MSAQTCLQPKSQPHTQAHSLASYVEFFDEADILVGLPAADDTRLNTAVCGISYDSREVQPGWLFVCKGVHFEERYLHDAISRGAIAYVFETGFFEQAGLDQEVFSTAALPIEVDNLREALILTVNHFHNRIWERITTIGITGTKGKSTTTYYIKSILDTWAAAEERPPTAVLSSIDTFDGVLSYESHLTTPEIFELHQHFANAFNSGIKHLVMEVSSQGLKYGRTAGVIFDVACFLNIGEDHISSIEHPDTEDYVAAKLRIFSQCKTAVINAATDDAERIFAAAYEAKQAEDIVTFSADATLAADLVATHATPIHEGELNGLRFTALSTVDGKKVEGAFTLGMTGLFNVENALAAIAVARILNVPEEHIRTGLLAARSPGRMEFFRLPNGAVVLIDYAHNWMSFEKLFESVESEYPGTRRTIVFGCPGYKALGRRRELGVLSGRFCEMTYLTEEDAGEEPVPQICEQIAAFVEGEGGAYSIILDREEAINESLDDAMRDASGKTVVMITGKGRETRQKRGLEYIPVISDVEIVENYLRR